MIGSLINNCMSFLSTHSGQIALVFPIMMIWAKGKVRSEKKWLVIQAAVFILYVAGILHFTLVGRTSDAQRINLTLFWKYPLFHDAQYRWEVFGNIYLFIPFGFLLGFAAKRHFLQSLLIGFLFSVCIEAAQYFFCLGMCELDDVFHNSLGTALGYGYWKALSWVETKHGQDIRAAVHRAAQYGRRLGAKGLAEIKSKIERGRKK